MHKRVVSSFAVSCALVVLTNLAGCADTPTAPLGVAEEQMMVELEKRYAAGAISKEEYERLMASKEEIEEEA